MGADRHAVGLRERDCPAHHRRIAGVKSARDVGRRDAAINSSSWPIGQGPNDSPRSELRSICNSSYASDGVSGETHADTSERYDDLE